MPKDVIWENANSIDKVVEKICCEIRTNSGVEITQIENYLNKKFNMTSNINLAVESGAARFLVNQNLLFSEQEWFRENSWVREVLNGFDIDYSNLSI